MRSLETLLWLFYLVSLILLCLFNDSTGDLDSFSKPDEAKAPTLETFTDKDDSTTIELDTSANPNSLDWKLKLTTKQWTSPTQIWDLLEFPTEPGYNESQALQEIGTLLISYPDFSQFNVEVEDGVIKGTLNCECGVPNPRIVGVEKKRANDIPWTVALALKQYNQSFCGASIINNKYLLTAGHCVRSFNEGDIEIWMNDEATLLNHTDISKRLVYGVDKIIRHPEYKAYYNDIALIKLNDTIPLGDTSKYLHINAVCLPANNEDKFDGRVGTVAGWGLDKSGGSPSDVLYKIDVPILSNEECVTKSKYGNNVKDNMMCAGFLETGGADACQGDSGGPLVVKDHADQFVQVGIVSWGLGCAQPFKPGVYTRIGVYPEWILENTQDAEWCQKKSTRQH